MYLNMYLNMYLCIKIMEVAYIYIYVCADVNETTSLLSSLAGQEILADPRLCLSTFKLNIHKT